MQRPMVNPLNRKVNPEMEEMAKFYEETLGFTPNSLFTMMHRPRISRAFLELNQAVMENKGRVSSDLKRLIAYLSSMTTGCRYCEAHAIRAAERYGAKPDKIIHIWEFRTHEMFTDAERAAFELSIASSSVPNAVTDEIAQEMRNHWNDGEIVEILGVIALFGYLNRWNDSMGTQLESPAIESGEKYLSRKGWTTGKHKYDGFDH